MDVDIVIGKPATVEVRSAGELLGVVPSWFGVAVRVVLLILLVLALSLLHWDQGHCTLGLEQTQLALLETHPMNLNLI